MSNLKFICTPASNEDKLPDKRRSDQVFWANARKDIKHPCEIPTQPRTSQHLYNLDSNLSLPENLLAKQSSNNAPPQYQNGDYSFRICSSLENSLNDFVSQGPAHYPPLSGWGYQGSTRGLLGEDMPTSQNYIDCPLDLCNESIAGEGNAYSTEVPVTSIAYRATTPDVQVMVPGAVLHSVTAATPSLERLPDDFPLAVDDVGVTTKLVADTTDIRGSPAGINPTTLATLRQQILQGEQINELWRERDYIKEVIYSVGKLGGRLQSWNKHQMDVVQETPHLEAGEE